MRFLYLLLLIIPFSLFAQEEQMLPYLQTPTSTSMYVCWFASSSNESAVQYGTTSELGLNANGDIHSFDTDTIWHWVKLTDLSPDTHYYYKCITGSQESTVYSFTTPPIVNTPDGHLRIIYIGDTQYEPPPVVTNVSGVVDAIQSKMLELYGVDWQQKINLICHSGDIVEWTGLPDPASTFIHQYIVPFGPLSPYIPSMIAPGNHDFDNAGVNVLYDLLKVEEIGGPEGEKYYSFDLADSKFIFLNTNGLPVGQGTTQINWLDSQLNEANANNDTDFIFAVGHHYGHSEIVPEHETAWTQNAVIPELISIPKPTLLSCGHAHAYERGTHPTAHTRLYIGGGGGADLDRWGQEDPVDYPETNIALDYWMYTIIDVDLATHHYEAKVFSLGNPDVPLNNVLIDSWSQSTTPVIYLPNTISAKAPEGGQVKLVSAPAMPYPDFSLMSSEIQVSANSSFSSNIIDSSRNWEDIFENTGSPNFTPIDVNAGVDLKRYTITNSSVQEGETYYWRIRYRSQNTDWSDWSIAQQFTYTPVPLSADFVNSEVTAANIPVQFTDTSVGDPTEWAWDFNNDGTPESTVQDPVWTFTAQGVHSVTLTVTINSQQYAVTKQIQVGVHNSDQENIAALTEMHLYPNPSKGIINVSYELKKASTTEITVYDLRGKLVRHISKQYLANGVHTSIWDGTSQKGHKAASGIYIIHISTAEGTLSSKVVLLN